MDYRIFNPAYVIFFSFFWRIRTGVGHTDSESAQHFLLGNTLTNVSCAPDADGVRTSGRWISSQTLYRLSFYLREHASDLWRESEVKTTQEDVLINEKRRTKMNNKYNGLDVQCLHQVD